MACEGITLCAQWHGKFGGPFLFHRFRRQRGCGGDLSRDKLQGPPAMADPGRTPQRGKRMCRCAGERKSFELELLLHFSCLSTLLMCSTVQSRAMAARMRRTRLAHLGRLGRASSSSKGLAHPRDEDSQMNTTRLLTTLAAAAALTGGIGLAYAQTTTTSTSTNTAGTTSGSPAMSSSSTMPAATDTTTTTTTTPTAPAEPTPKADRG